MNNKSIAVYEGESVDLVAHAEDATYQTATLLIGEVGSAAIFSHPATFTDLVADLSLTDEENTVPVGEYKYMIRIDFTDGDFKLFPDPSKCSPNELPDFIVRARIIG